MGFVEGLAAQLGKAAAATGSLFLLDRLKRRWAARQAAQDGAGAEVFHLESLLRKELQELARSSGLPQNLSHNGFRNWLLGVDQEKRLAKALLGQARGDADAQSLRELAQLYTQFTGERPEAATGAVNYVLSHLMRVIRSTASGRDALDSALQLRAAGQLEEVFRASCQAAPTEDVYSCVRSMARQLLQAGAQTWSMPARVVPLSIDRRFGPDLANRESANFDRASELVEAQKRVVIFGDGGLGKTTLLLHVCSKLVEQGSRIPLFLDAATWARSGRGLLEYLAGREQALASQVQAAHLARLAADGKLALFIIDPASTKLNQAA